MLVTRTHNLWDATASWTHWVGCSALRLTPDCSSFTHVRNQVIQCVVAAAAVGELQRSKVNPLHQAEDALGQGFSEPPPWSPWSAQPWRGAAAPRPGEPPAFPAEAVHSRPDETSRRWGCLGFLSPLPGTLWPLRFPPVPAQPLQGAPQNLASTVVPLTSSGHLRASQPSIPKWHLFI